MRVFLERSGTWIPSAASSVSDLLQELGLLPETVLVVRNGTLATEDEPLDQTDEVKVLSVISGG
jgi:sulfur carrier protein ThiS